MGEVKVTKNEQVTRGLALDTEQRPSLDQLMKSLIKQRSKGDEL